MEFPKEAIADFCRRWKVAEFSVFGSVARGEERPDSDVDVMLEFTPDEEWDLFDLGRMAVELQDIFGREVDLVERGTVVNPFRRQSIERDLKVIYAA